MKRASRVLAEEWIAAWNSHDLARIMGHYSDDVVFTSPFVASLAGRADGTVRGKVELEEYFSRGFRAYPDLKFTLIRAFSGLGGLVVEYASVNGLVAAEAMEFDAAGKVVRARAHYAES